MDILKDKTNKELLNSLIEEIAKASNELKCARGDLDKATSRLRFLVVVANELIERQGDR